MPNPAFPLDSGGLRVGGAVDPYDAGTVAYYPRGRGTASGGTTFTRDSRELAVYHEGWTNMLGTVLSFGTAGTAWRVGTAADLAQRQRIGIINEGTVNVYIGTVNPPGTANAAWFVGTVVENNRWEIPANSRKTWYLAPDSGTAQVRVYEAA